MNELYFIIAALTIGCVFLGARLGKAHKENDHLKLKVKLFEGQQLAVKFNELLLNVMPANKPKLNKTTEQLLVLAVKSNNANEAAAAATQACKRIHKELGLS